MDDGTPVGLIGVPLDLRASLPAHVTAPAALDVDRSYGHVLALGRRGNDTKLRVDTWTVHDGDRSVVVGVVVEVLENPNGTIVTWTATDRDPAGPRLEIRVVWRTVGSTHELVVTGRVDPVAAVFVADDDPQ